MVLDSKHLFVEDIEQELLDSDVFKVFATEGAHTVIVDRGKARVIAINGSPTIIITTAEARPKAEILNRFIMLNLDESEAQTRAIFKAIAAEIEIDHRWMLVFDHLKPQKVAIPWIERIAERFPACKVRARRDFHRFRAMICASAILHQRQRQFDQAGSLVAQQQDFDIAISLFQFTNPGAFLVDLTHTQKKAYEDLATLARRCPSVSIGVDFTLSDVRPTPSEKTATTCECGSVYLSRACISHHYGNRTVRQWDFLLERLQNKGAVTSRTLINPATKREVTAYAIKIMNTTDTFDLKDNNTTTIDSSSKDGVYVGVGFGENTPESSKIDTDGHPQGETSTIPVPGRRGPGGRNSQDDKEALNSRQTLKNAPLGGLHQRLVVPTSYCTSAGLNPISFDTPFQKVCATCLSVSVIVRLRPKMLNLTLPSSGRPT